MAVAPFLSQARVLRLPSFPYTISSSSYCKRTEFRFRARHQADPPNLILLAEKARLALTPEEVEEFSPTIAKVVDWFAQLQEVDLDGVQPAVRVGGEEGATALRADIPTVFKDRDAMISSSPELEGPYLKVPKILRENVE